MEPYSESDMSNKCGMVKLSYAWVEDYSILNKDGITVSKIMINKKHNLSKNTLEANSKRVCEIPRVRGTKATAPQSQSLIVDKEAIKPLKIMPKCT